MPYDIIESCYDHKYVRMPRKWKEKEKKKENNEKKSGKKWKKKKK